jgi:oxaloacetate decarboxylase beta subunit
MEQLFIGFTSFTWQAAVMILVGIALIWLAVKKEYEPMLLLPIGFGTILVNLPLAVVFEHEGAPGVLKILFDAGIQTELFPVLIFIAVGAMCDFRPMFKNPVMMFFGVAAQFGIFMTVIFAILLGFDLKVASAIGIIGARTPHVDLRRDPLRERVSGSDLGGGLLVHGPRAAHPAAGHQALTTKHERMIKMPPTRWIFPSPW